MAKYDPIGVYLRRQKTDEIELSFRDIERMVGILPKAALSEAWWTDTDPVSASPQTRAWKSAGFEAEADQKGERVRFTRAR